MSANGRVSSGQKKLRSASDEVLRIYDLLISFGTVALVCFCSVDVM